MIRDTIWRASKRAAHFRGKLQQKARRLVNVGFDQEVEGWEAFDGWSYQVLEFFACRARFFHA